MKKKRGKKIFSIRNDKGLSPIITTLLLVALTIVIISVIFLWFRGMVQEGVVKFGKNIQLVCDDVKFQAGYSSGTISLENTGNVPIYDVNLRIYTGGNYQTKDLKTLSAGSNWPTTGLNPGATFSGDVGSDVGSANKIIVLPVLIGTAPSGKKTFMCEGQYGQEIDL